MSENEIKDILTKYKVVAIVGMSDTVGKPSHRVGTYLKMHGYQIIPVNPTIGKVLGCKSYKSLLDIPERIQKTIDIVDIFRKPEDVPPIVEQTIKLKQRFGRPCVVWMQLDVVNEAAAEAARSCGLVVVMDKCIMREHRHCRRDET
jgi:uncharacterized protein